VSLLSRVKHFAPFVRRAALQSRIVALDIHFVDISCVLRIGFGGTCLEMHVDQSFFLSFISFYELLQITLRNIR